MYRRTFLKAVLGIFGLAVVAPIKGVEAAADLVSPKEEVVYPYIIAPYIPITRIDPWNTPPDPWFVPAGFNRGSIDIAK